MRGFQPQHFADGGLVQGFKRVFGMDEERNARVAAYRAQQAQEKAQQQAAAAPAPAPQRAITEYAGDSAMKRREKAAGLADGGTVKPRGFKAGGLIRGPGTGTSDSIETEKRPGTFIMPADSTQAIGPESLEEMGEVDDSAMEEQGEEVPVRLSNGEFELPPEKVQALGEAVLTVMRDATHKPVRGFAPQAEPQEPRQFFANGGVVDDEQKKRLQNQTAMYVQGAQAQAASRPAAPAVTPAPAAPAPAPTVPRAAGFMPGTRAVFNESGKAIGDLAKQGRYAAAAGETARAALAYGPAVVDDVVGGALRAVVPPAVDAGKQFFGAEETTPALDTSQPTKTVSTATPPAPPAPVQSPEASTAPAAAPAAAISVQQPEVVAPAQADTSRTAAGFVPGVASTTIPQVAAPVVRNSTNDWAARKALDNMATAASSITNRPEWQSGSTTIAGSARGFTGTVDPQGKVAAYKAAVANDQALQQAQPGLDQTAMRENGGLQREAVQQQGGLQREQVQQAGANTRASASNAIDQRRVGLEEQVRGFDIREGQRKEQLFARYDAAKTPEEKAAVAQQIRDLSGKQTESPWKVQVTPTTKNADGSTTDGSIYRYNTQTGAVERVDAGVTAPLPLPPKDQLKAGQVYQTPRGPARWDGKQFQTA